MTPPTREPLTATDIMKEYGERTDGLYDDYAYASEIAELRNKLTVCSAERDAAVRELEETRKREALSDAIVDECDSDITKLVQERADLRTRLAACERVMSKGAPTPMVFLEYMERNYPHRTMISDIGWHTPKIWRAAVDALRAAVAAETQGE